MARGGVILFGRNVRGTVVSTTWNSAEQRAYVVYRDEAGQNRTVYAPGASPWEARQAVIDDLMERARVIRESRKR
jgi:hypothetical protein